MYPKPKMAPKMGEGGQIWLKCITGDLIMMIRDKNNIFERVENFHADLAWNYPSSFLAIETLRTGLVREDSNRFILIHLELDLEVALGNLLAWGSV